MKKRRIKTGTIWSVILLALCISLLFSGCGRLKAIYTPGIYTASADGYGGPVSVEVEFNESSILSVRVVSHNETPHIGDRAVDELPSKILDSQTWDVDAITSATITSDAILNGVKDCIEQATIKE